MRRWGIGIARAVARAAGGRATAGRRRGACALALPVLVAGALGLLAGPASAATGSITGRVTAAATHEPVAGFEVCAMATAIFSPEGEKLAEEGIEPGTEQFACTTTAATGEYTVAGLGAGSFFVGFSNPFQGTLNYVTQFYKGTSNFEEAVSVSVSAGAVTTGIDAELQEGAQLSGIVTSAATGAPLEGALVCALPTPPREGACARSGAGGGYTIVGLEGGSYSVSAIAPGFSFGFYGSASTAKEATQVRLAVKEDRAGINIALQPRPASTGNPGATEQGSLGAGGSLGSGPTGHGTPSTGGVALANALIEQHARGGVVVRLLCSSLAPCRGKVALSAPRQVRRGHRRLTEMVGIGSERFSAGSGQTFSVKIKLTPLGRKMLELAHGRLAARLRIVQSAPPPPQTILKRVLLVGRRAATRGSSRPKRGPVSRAAGP